MSQEGLILERPTAFIEAAQDTSCDIIGEGHAMACARHARDATSLEEAAAWTDAAVACWDRVLTEIRAPVIRNGRELSSFGTRARLAERFPESAQAAKCLAQIVNWLDAGIERLTKPEDLRRAFSAPLGEECFVALERFSHLRPLWRSGLLPARLDPWFRVADSHEGRAH